MTVDSGSGFTRPACLSDTSEQCGPNNRTDRQEAHFLIGDVFTGMLRIITPRLQTHKDQKNKVMAAEEVGPGSVPSRCSGTS